MNSSFHDSNDIQQYNFNYYFRNPNFQSNHKRCPSNSSSVIKHFFHPDIEMVKKLKFFIPESGKINERNKSMFNPNISKDEAAISNNFKFEYFYLIKILRFNFFSEK